MLNDSPLYRAMHDYLLGQADPDAIEEIASFVESFDGNGLVVTDGDDLRRILRAFGTPPAPGDNPIEDAWEAGPVDPEEGEG